MEKNNRNLPWMGSSPIYPERKMTPKEAASQKQFDGIVKVLIFLFTVVVTVMVIGSFFVTQ
ncbi:MAG: hypothetical protein WCP97_06485 [bacterium]